VPTATEGDVFARYTVKLAEMRQSVLLCRQALDRIAPTGAYDCGDFRYVPPPESAPDW
jgi:NADH-quinone oxidoreductase subunit D